MTKRDRPGKPRPFGARGDPEIQGVSWVDDDPSVRTTVTPWVPEGVDDPSESSEQGEVSEVAVAGDGPVAEPDAEHEEEGSDTPTADLEEMQAHHQEALATQKEELENAFRQPYVDAAHRLDNAVVTLAQRVGEDVVQLALRLAEAVIRREVTLDSDLLVDNVSRALKLAGVLERLTLRCHPEDAAVLRDILPDLAEASSGRPVEVTVRPSDDVERGGCIVLFPDGIVDARISNQLSHLSSVVEEVIRGHFETTELGSDEAESGEDAS